MNAGELLITLIGWLAGVSMTLYVYMELIRPRLQRIRKVMQKHPEERAAELMGDYVRRELELDRVKRDVSMRAPHIRMLRAGVGQHETTCLFINDGGTARELDVSPVGPFQATIEPRDALHPGETGRIVLSEAPTLLPLLQFRLTYLDSYSQHVARLYAFSETEGRFKEI
jgi:hypothetical protein